MILVLIFLVIILYIFYLKYFNEYFDLTGAFVDLATYDEPEKYMYGS
jgi:hypothetical protein